MAEADSQKEVKNRKHDWIMFIGGILIVLAGFAFFVLPSSVDYLVLAIVAGVLFLAYGIVSIISYIRFRKATDQAGWMLASGILDLIIGVILLIHPMLTAEFIPWFVAAFLLVYSVYAIIAGIVLHGKSDGWVMMIISGIIGVCCALLIMFVQFLFAFLVGLFLIVRGILMMVCGLSAPRLYDMRYL